MLWILRWSGDFPPRVCVPCGFRFRHLLFFPRTDDGDKVPNPRGGSDSPTICWDPFLATIQTTMWPFSLIEINTEMGYENLFQHPSTMVNFSLSARNFAGVPEEVTGKRIASVRLEASDGCPPGGNGNCEKCWPKRY